MSASDEEKTQYGGDSDGSDILNIHKMRDEGGGELAHDKHGDDQDDASTVQHHPAWVSESLTLPQEVLFVSVVCMAQLLTQAGFFGVMVLVRTIGRDFGVSQPARLGWLIAGFSLTVGTFILFSGRLGDLFGYKRIFIIGMLWFSLWSMVAGLSVYSNYTLAVFARVLQGIGPALCLPNGLALLGTAYPPGHRKAMMFAFFGALAPIGAVLGAAFASVLSLAWWPWAFWAMSIVTVIVAILGYFVIPVVPQDTSAAKSIKSFKAFCTELDVVGGLVGITGLILFNFSWTQAPISGWHAPSVIVTLVLSIILFATFAVIETKYAVRPLLPFSAINADVGFILAAVMCGWGSFGIWISYLVLKLQDTRHLSNLLTAAWFSPVTMSGACAAVITGKLLGPLQVKPAVVMVIALSAFSIGSILTAFAPTHQAYWAQIFVTMVVMPFGMDMSFPAATLVLSDAVPREHQGIGASLVNTVVNYGIALAVGFAGTVEVHVNHGGKTTADRLDGYRGAEYLGIGIALLGLGVSITFLAREFLFKGKTNQETPAQNEQV